MSYTWNENVDLEKDVQVDLNNIFQKIPNRITRHQIPKSITLNLHQTALNLLSRTFSETKRTIKNIFSEHIATCCGW